MLALLFASGLAFAQASPPPLVVLVRHAEKAAEPAGDPPLSAAGLARAQALTDVLRDAGVTAIVTTQFRRTRETAEPIAKALGLTPEVVPAGAGGIEGHVEAVAAAVRRHPGGVVLVVGHGNTIPALIAALGGPRLPDLCESAHADLFFLDLREAKPRLVRARYGAPDPACE